MGVMNMAVATKNVGNGAADLAAVKTRQQTAWSSGDYAVVGSTLQIVGETLCEALDLRAGQKVLDVAAGNGNATLAAARRWCHVTSTDYVETLLVRGRARATAEGWDNIEFKYADAEALPFSDASFDAVLSTYGVMFTPDQAKAASELLRVCKSRGKIGLANWTPDGFAGEIFRVNARYLPPPPGLTPPTRWGTEAGLRELFGDDIADLTVTPRQFTFRYRSPEHWVEFFRTWFGPTLQAFAALDAAGQADLERDLLALLRRFNRADDGTLVAPGEYLEVVAIRR
jgi:ubiquinone/menaquinone biosynthesis C-methylase UbiE